MKINDFEQIDDNRYEFKTKDGNLLNGSFYYVLPDESFIVCDEDFDMFDLQIQLFCKKENSFSIHWYSGEIIGAGKFPADSQFLFKYDVDESIFTKQETLRKDSLNWLRSNYL